MKYLPSLVLSFVIGTVLAVGCADDDRPVAPLPVGGDSSVAGAGAMSGGEPSSGGSAAAGEGGVSFGNAGQPASAGQGPDAAGAGGAGGEEPPFAAPYYIVYAAPKLGVDARNPTAARWNGGSLVNWTSNLDQNGVHDIGTASNLSAGSDGVVQWGRWASGTLGGIDTAITLNEQQGFHYAIGSGTTTLPASGTASYELVGHTTVTVGDGSEEPGLLSVDATAEFAATTKVGITVNLTVGGVTYVVVTTGTYITPATSEVETWDAEHPAAFAGVPYEPSQGICADGCSRSIQGFFAGPNAEQLAFVVHVFDGAGGSDTSVSSVIVMKKK